MNAKKVTVTDVSAKVMEQDEAFAPVSFTIQNRGAVSVFLGGEDVDDADLGWELTPSDEVSIDFPSGQAETLWAVCSAAETADLKILYTSGV